MHSYNRLLRRVSKFLCALALLALVLVPAKPAHAAGFVVDTLNDNTIDNSTCTLREAIQSANNAGNGDCGSDSSGNDTITFSVSGTINLNSTLPSIVSGQGTLTINGGGTITLSGDSDNNGSADVQVFVVNSSANLTLRNLTITKGTASNGGGVDNSGTLTVTNSTFSTNGGGIGGGVYNSGTLIVSNSTFSDNTSVSGGGISNYDTLTVTSSTFSDNTSVSGGGISNYGTLTVTSSTFSGNSATTGGGIDNNSGTVTVTNSTFSGNSATSGGGIANSGTVTITSSTLSHSTTGGAIHNVLSGTVMLRNTILAHSNSDPNCTGTITDGGGNLQNGGSVASSCGSFTNANPQLGALADNGGPTQTRELQPGSAALYLATANCPAVDQRGMLRLVPCDSGAFQLIKYLFLPLIMR